MESQNKNILRFHNTKVKSLQIYDKGAASCTNKYKEVILFTYNLQSIYFSLTVKVSDIEQFF